MIRESLAHDLPEPAFAQRGSEFVTVLWRDWLTDRVMAQLDLNERQRKALPVIRGRGQITNREYREITGTIARTAARDLEDLVGKRVLRMIGTTGRSTVYAFAREHDINETNRTVQGPQPEQDINETNRTSGEPAGRNAPARAPGPVGRRRRRKDKPEG